MRHPFEPKIDCVFRSLLGFEDDRALLIRCLDAMLGGERELEAAAQSVTAAREREKTALQREEAERKAKEAALAEIERLKAQLRDQ